MGPLKIQILGGGGMGTVMAKICGDQGHSVIVRDQNPDVYRSWSETGCNNLYDYLRGRKLPETVEFAPPLPKGEKHKTSGYDYTIIAVQMGCLSDLLQSLQISEYGGPLVLLQKGVIAFDRREFVTPDDLAYNRYLEVQNEYKQSDWRPAILTFTGSAFARNILDGVQAGMILAARQCDMSAAERFVRYVLQPAGIFWTYFTNEIRPVALFNALRTIASCEAGVLAGFMQGKGMESAVALALQGIERERNAIARDLLHKDKLEVFDPLSRVRGVLDADLLMCMDESSRNYAFGLQLGALKTPDEALTLASSYGVIECIPNINAFAAIARTHKPNWQAQYPYLYWIWRIINSQATIEEAAEQIMARRPTLRA